MLASRSTIRRLAVVACGLSAFSPAIWLLTPGSLGQPAPQSVSQDRPARGFAHIVDSVKPAVIGIRVRVADNEARLSFQRPGAGDGLRNNNRNRFVTSQGSGFFISADGYAVTNDHVIKGSKTAEIRTDDNNIYIARVVGADAKSDLAVLKVDGREDFPYVNFAVDLPQVGDWIITIGNPFGLGGTVTAGIVSARGRDLLKESHEDLIQIDAPINHGSSGGPTFDLNGNVIGVNTMIFSPTGGSVGIAFDIPSDRVKAIVTQLKDKGSVTRVTLGIQVQAVSAEIAEGLGLGKPGGALVADVTAGGPADAAGVLAGDVIETLNGERLENCHQFARKLDELAAGTSLPLGLIRNGEKKSVAATVAQLVAAPEIRPERLDSERDAATAAGSDPAASLGLTLRAAAGGSGGNGVVVTDIDPASLAADRGLEAGDVILEVAGRIVAAPEDVYSALSSARGAGKRLVLMRIKSSSKTRFLAVPVS